MIATNPMDAEKDNMQLEDAIHFDGVGPSTKKIKPSIDSLEAYLIYALKNPTKKLDTKDSLISRLAKNPKLSEESIKELVLLEKNKFFFTSFKNLLRFSESIIGYPFLKDSLRGYLKDSLCRNEIVVKLELQGSILNLENSLPLDLCFKKIQSLSSKDLTEEYFKKVKPKEWQNYISTIILALAEWYAKTRGMSPSQLVDLLNNSLWSNALKKRGPEFLVNNLLASTNFELIASATVFYQQKTIDATNRLIKSENQFAEMTAHNQKLHGELQDKELLIIKLQAEIAELNASHIDALTTSEVESQTLSITLKNQLEDLRVKNLRLIKSSVELLTDGLTAIGRPEPKVNVMKDHAQRVLDSLNAELERLRNLGK
jgi:hypothetical protein